MLVPTFIPVSLQLLRCYCCCCSVHALTFTETPCSLREYKCSTKFHQHILIHLSCSQFARRRWDSEYALYILYAHLYLYFIGTETLLLVKSTLPICPSSTVYCTLNFTSCVQQSFTVQMAFHCPWLEQFTKEYCISLIPWIDIYSFVFLLYILTMLVYMLYCIYHHLSDASRRKFPLVHLLCCVVTSNCRTNNNPFVTALRMHSKYSTVK